LLAEIKQGRALGFTGKTLLHPKQLALSNQLFGINQHQLNSAREVVDAWKQAEREGSGVVVVNGRLVESLHVEAAQSVMALASAIEARGF
jgi:citrate lyase subunit beta/citryl-CoA lyase